MISVNCSTTSNVVSPNVDNHLNDANLKENSESEPNKTTSMKRKYASNGNWDHLVKFTEEMKENQNKKFELLEKLSQAPEQSDLELFFSSVCKTVQKFSAKDQALIKMRIHQIVNEKEISYLESLPLEMNNSMIYNDGVNLDCLE